jgi:MFS family permease
MRSLSLLRRNADFRRLYLATLVSFMGDWFAIVAVSGHVADLSGGSAAMVTLVLVTQTLAIAVFSPIGGHLADRLNRRTLMIAADLIRAALALGLLLVDAPGQLVLVYVLLGGIGSLTAVFEPTTNAAVPNLVDREDLPAANILMGAAWGTMLAVGGALGGIVATTLGRDAAFIGDALSFLVSAFLIMRIRRSFSETRSGEHPGLREAVVETVRYARRDRRVLALLSSKASFGIFGAVVGLLPVLSLSVFRAGDRGTGILLAARGIGALVGPFLARRATSDLRLLFVAIAVSFAVFGASYWLVALSGTLATAAIWVLAGHLGGGAQWTLSTYGLQRIVPDHIRGRVFSFDFGLVTLSMSASILLGGWAADRFGVLVVIRTVGLLGIAWGLVWGLLTRNIRRGSSFDPAAAAAADA